MYRGNDWNVQYAVARGARLASGRGGNLWYTSDETATLEYLETFAAIRERVARLLDDALMFVPRQYLVQAKSFDIGAAAGSRSVLLELLDFGLPRLELRLTCDRGAGISAWEATLPVAGITDRAKKIDGDSAVARPPA